MVAPTRNCKTLKIEHDMITYVLMATHSAKLNDRWSNTKKNFKDFLNEQLRNKMEEIKVKKAHKLDNGNDPSP